MATFRPPKPTKLTKNETISSFETWKHNQKYNLQQDPYRGLVDDGDDVTVDKKTAADKLEVLQLMLDQIANWCPVISRTIIVNHSTSLNDVWQKIREHYGFMNTGGHFLDLSNIKQEPDERPEDLFQRVFMFFEDNLLKANGLTHHGDRLTADETFSPSIENTITWYWLKLLHPGLPALVKQRYGSELWNKSLASIKTEISQAMSSLLEELSSLEEAKVFCSNSRPYSNKSFYKQNSSSDRGTSKMSCILCKTAGRPSNSHWLSQCRFLPPEEKRALTRSIQCDESEEVVEGDVEEEEEEAEDDAYIDSRSAVVRRVGNMSSPILDFLYNHSTINMTLDSGATSNLILEAFARRIGIKIYPNSQVAGQADGVSHLDTVGEVHFSVTRNGRTFKFDGLVVTRLNDDVLAGMPFLYKNDIGLRPSKSLIIIHGSEKIKFDAHGRCEPMIRRSSSFLLKAPKVRSVVLPGESLTVSIPEEASANRSWAVEPRYDHTPFQWFTPHEVTASNRQIELTNTSDEPVIIGKHAHVAQIRRVAAVENVPTTASSHVIAADSDPESVTPLPSSSVSTTLSPPTVASIRPASTSTSLYSDCISIDPNNLVSPMAAKSVREIHRMYDRVFRPNISVYNGHSGNIQCHINMGPAQPPQRKAHLPQYDHGKMVILQQKFDEMEHDGILIKPEEAAVIAEYMNMSFLVAKPQAENSFRLVTAFREIGEYSKPQPSVMPSVEDTLRVIGKWKYLIKTDLKQAYYQIPLSKESMRYAGTATPFKGVRVYARAAMGCPGSETALEELMDRVIGHLVMEGSAAKVADDCYCGGETVEGALSAYEQLLAAFNANDLVLNPIKTIVFPKRCVILGWVWELGTLSASPHRIAALTAVEPPSTVKALRSFIGAYKYISRVIRWHSDYINPLDQLVGGKESKDKITWMEEMISCFRTCQESLKTCEPVNIAKPSDFLWIHTDGSVRPATAPVGGIAATLFLVREGKVLLGGIFNAPLKKAQRLWLPCEVEALAIGSAITYFSPIIVQSNHRATVLTDSLACTQAYDRMCRGLFSHSARVMTFLTAVCRYQVIVKHKSGKDIPFTDFSSRHPIECTDQSCQVCRFIQEFAETAVRRLMVQDVFDGHVRMPFTNRPSWLESQRDCPDLRKVFTYLTSGARSRKKENKMRDVKTYLQRSVIASDGLLVVRDIMPLQQHCERIVVPRKFVRGLLTAIHLRFGHPSANQLKLVAKRYFYAINLDSTIESVTAACDVCNSLKFVPQCLVEQTTSEPQAVVGTSFAFDVLKREQQLIAILRETITSFSATMIIKSESQVDLRDSLIILSSELKGFVSEMRVDPAPGLACLRNDQVLKGHGIVLDVGREKNPNKNPVAERAVQELGQELLKIQPAKGPISHVTLATAQLNSRIRRDGLSARELWTQGDQFTGRQFPIDDDHLIQNQHEARTKNHTPSALSKLHSLPNKTPNSVTVGALVYLISERSKLQARDKYLVVSINKDMCTLRKFTRQQFRKKEYVVPLSSVYPIVNHSYNIQPSSSNESESDEASSTEEYVHDPTSVDVAEVAEEGETEEAVGEPNVEVPVRRPRRRVYPPAWHADYVMDR